MQSLLRAIFPDHCVICDTMVAARPGLCGACWRDTPFILGLACDTCGAPLPGEADGPVLCDECLSMPRGWSRGRAAMVYDGAARRMALAIKHGDRLDIVPSAAIWMARAAAPLLCADQVIVPVPAHWRRRLRRRYDQAAELARALGRALDRPVATGALVRTRPTASQDGKGVEARFANLGGAIVPSDKASLTGRAVLLVDDVMTSGATLAAAAEAAQRGGAARVDAVVLARAVKDA